MAKKVPKKQPKKAAVSKGSRTRKLDKKQQRAKARIQARKQKPIPGSFNLSKQVFGTLRKSWKPLGGIFLVYLILNVIFATSFLSGLRTTADGIVRSHNLGDAVNGFGSLLGSGALNSSAGASVTQTIVLVLESLVIIWALRQLLAGEAVRIKQAYYQAMTPFVPYVVVAFVIILQLLPAALGSTLLAATLSANVITNGFLITLFAILLVVLSIWSIYMISSSIFALYIVTLPDMQPRQALRSARNLVRFRRWKILRRLLFLPVCVLLLMAIVMVPVILLVPAAVPYVFFVLCMLAVLVAHTYLYSLYRGLLA